MGVEQQPLELVLSRSWMSNLVTPAFLVDADGTLVFYNDAAGELLGLRFEEAGPLEPSDWGTRFAPMDDEGRQVPLEELPLMVALRTERPAHTSFSITADGGAESEIQVTAFPIVGTGGLRGAIAIFWATEPA